MKVGFFPRGIKTCVFSQPRAEHQLNVKIMAVAHAKVTSGSKSKRMHVCVCEGGDV